MIFGKHYDEINFERRSTYSLSTVEWSTPSPFRVMEENAERVRSKE